MSTWVHRFMGSWVHGVCKYLHTTYSVIKVFFYSTWIYWNTGESRVNNYYSISKVTLFITSATYTNTSTYRLRKPYFKLIRKYHRHTLCTMQIRNTSHITFIFFLKILCKKDKMIRVYNIFETGFIKFISKEF